MLTPWGTSQTVTTHQRGYHYVTTGSHGGYMLSAGFAAKFLSLSAVHRGLRYNGYVCFEEDCAYAMVEFELPMVTTQEYKDGLFKTLSRWYPNYLIERGFTPIESLYQEWKDDQVEQQRRADKDPNLVVSALNAGENRVKVWTAAGTEHFVTAESYADRSHKYNLSQMVLVAA
jgi:hypothetical protein